jgi:hypothetical protein
MEHTHEHEAQDLASFFSSRFFDTSYSPEASLNQSMVKGGRVSNSSLTFHDGLTGR